MNHANIGFIGAGNMASSLIGGLIADGYDATKIWVSCPDQAALQHLNNLFGVHTSLDNKEVAKQTDVVVIAVKPNVVKAVAEQIKDIVITRKPLVLSVAAGVPIATLQNTLSEDIAIVRCMPNTPALIGCGASGLFANDVVNEEQREVAESILRAVGIVQWVEKESQMDIVTSLSGSGPAYFFYFIEAMENEAVTLGLDKECAHLLAVQTALGAARMALESDQDITTLRQRVTSPGGTTERALSVLQQGDLQGLIAKALAAAVERSHEIAEQL